MLLGLIRDQVGLGKELAQNLGGGYIPLWLNGSLPLLLGTVDFNMVLVLQEHQVREDVGIRSPSFILKLFSLD